MYKHGMSNHLLDGLAEKFPHCLGLAPQMALVCFQQQIDTDLYKACAIQLAMKAVTASDVLEISSPKDRRWLT